MSNERKRNGLSPSTNWSPWTVTKSLKAEAALAGGTSRRQQKGGNGGRRFTWLDSGG